MDFNVGMESNTWLVQTLLKVTNVKVCASSVDGRSSFAIASGIKTVLIRS